jgi:hypothetical protein
MKNYNFCKYGNLPIEDKSWELQITNTFEGPFFNFSFSWSRKTDHAGPELLIELPKFYFCFKIYDIRHWDYENDKYETYNSENKSKK